MQGAARGPLERLVAKREAHGSCGGLHSAARLVYRRNTACIIAVELLVKRHCLQARSLVDEHEFNILPQELVEVAMQDGWPKKVNVVADCTLCACRCPLRHVLRRGPIAHLAETPFGFLPTTFLPRHTR
jgi:hypothetical protein